MGGMFAGACKRAVTDATSFEERIEEIQSDGVIGSDSVRRDSAAELLIKSSPEPGPDRGAEPRR